MMKEAPMQVPDQMRKQPDPILGLTAAFEADIRTTKINAGVGVYRNSSGNTYVPRPVRDFMETPRSGNPDYLSPSGEEGYLGSKPFLTGAARILFQESTNRLLEGRSLVAAGTSGGTRAVSLMVETYHKLHPDAPMVIGDPTWPNHHQIARASGMKVETFPHITKDQKFDLEANLEAIKQSPEDALVVFHAGKTHNPTGVNPQTEGEWEELARTMRGRQALFDAPYVGFGDGVREDTEAIRIFMNYGVSVAVALSFSKNAGLYKHRTGGLFIPMGNAEEARELQRFINYEARSVDSTPPAYGEEIMARVLNDVNMYGRWLGELEDMAANITSRRKLFARELPEYSFVEDQVGLFSMLPLAARHIQALRELYAVYMPASGRVNFGGLTRENTQQLAMRIRETLMFF